MLVSVNPFKRLPLYTVTLMNEIAKPAPNRLPPPHPFAVANAAYLRMRVHAKVRDDRRRATSTLERRASRRSASVS